MGAGASTSATATFVIDAECQRPLDASDLATLDANAARDEVVRLRGLLAAHADVIRRAVAEQQPDPASGLPQLQQNQQATREYMHSEQQTDASAVAVPVYCVDPIASAGDAASTAAVQARDPSDAALASNASRSSLALAPGIQEYLIACFAAADLDSSGVLSAYEFTRLLREHSELGLSPEDIQLLLAQTKWMDAKGDVTWQQFVQLAPQLLANLAVARDGDASGDGNATDWCACITPEGTPYYYNKRTQESVWDRPTPLLGDNRQQQVTTQQHQVVPTTVAVAAARTDSGRVRPRSR